MLSRVMAWRFAYWVGFVLCVAWASPARVARAEPNFLGVARCGACHEKEYADWQASGHARALARLSSVQQRNPVCRSCHTMVPTSDAAELSGVQCESCHGPGRRYAPAYVMRDAVLARMLGLTEITQSVCASCHSGETPSVKPFDFADLLPRVRHAEPSERTAGQEPTKPAS